MIVLRELQKKDVYYMLEWMHDINIQKNFKRNMLDISFDEAEKFISDSVIPKRLFNGANLHFAITEDANDEYLGTISLKNVDLNSASAEYAISTRKKVHGQGVAYKATNTLLKKAFLEYGLHRVYLNVLCDNIPAKKFYEKCGFKFEGEFRDAVKKGDRFVNLCWYSILKHEYKSE